MPGCPKVSVILPCYNAHLYLDCALQSVRAQTFEDLEIVIVDDGSSDPATIEFLEKLPDDIRIVRQKNLGLPGARNSGFLAARGEYVLPLDCDDWIAPTFLEKTLALLEASPDVAFVCTHMTMEGELKGVLKKSYNFLEQLFFNQLPYSLVVPKRLWEEVGGYDLSMRKGYEDWEFNIRLGERGYHGVVLPEPLFHYRILSGGMLKSISNHSHSQLWALIRERHPQLYTYSGLFRTWKAWRGQPATYPAYLLFSWYIVNKILPDRMCNMLLRHLLRLFSHARRVARAGGT